MPLQATSGAASYDAFGGGVPVAVNYIEDVFSTYLYTGTGATRTITNGIDLSTKGGMVWIKSRSAATNNFLFDTARSALNEINSNTTDAQASLANSLTAFNTTGFSLGSAAGINVNAATYASWTFRKQPKFFDVVTYTGDGISGRTVAHNLGSVPGCMIVKRTNTTSEWEVYHRSIGNTGFLALNTTDPTSTSIGRWNNTTPTSTVFTLGNSALVNNLNDTYVAYLFAHNAGGFGLTGTDNVISCGSYTGTGSAQDVSLGYEPQFLIIKNATTGSTNWAMLDNMRGLPVGTGDAFLKPNLSDAEVATSDFVDPTATGFRTILSGLNTNGNTFIYIAIRRGPMKVPTNGTSVFDADVATVIANRTITTNFPSDLLIARERNASQTGRYFWVDRLRSSSTAIARYLDSTQTGAEVSAGAVGISFESNVSIIDNLLNPAYSITSSAIYYNFRRATGFMDEVCYTGTGSARTVTHNLGAVPELMIIKSRSSGLLDWVVYNVASGNTNALLLNTNDAVFTISAWNNTTPTSSVFSTGATSGVNNSGATFVAYLFATCSGVSKVGSYTGTGTTLQVNCGFTGGARFVLIKRTDSTGDWYVWDTARGIIAGNDPYLLLNSTAAEVTGTDYVDTYSAGFELSSTAPAAINASGGTFIFLAIS